MKTDKELLQLAAKAVGKCLAGFQKRNTDPESGFEEQSQCWNPLTDDGDALRLAVDLNLAHGLLFTRAVHRHAVEQDISDAYAATRRAIVRAAAAIGEGME